MIKRNLAIIGGNPGAGWAQLIWKACLALLLSSLVVPTLRASPTRIVSASLASDEILWTLVQNKSKLIAFSTAVNDKKYSNLAGIADLPKERVGTTAEAIVALKPDLVFLASYNRPEVIRQLQKLKIPVILLEEFTGFADIRNSITKIGKATGEEKSAEKMIADFDQRLKKHPIPKSPPSCMNASVYGRYWGKNTIYHDIMSTAGCKNLIAEKGFTGWPAIGDETIAGLDPDWLIAVGEESERAQIIQSLAKSPAYRNLRALKAGRVIVIPDRYLSSVSHHVLEAVDRLAKQIHR